MAHPRPRTRAPEYAPLSAQQHSYISIPSPVRTPNVLPHGANAAADSYFGSVPAAHERVGYHPHHSADAPGFYDFDDIRGIEAASTALEYPHAEGPGAQYGMLRENDMSPGEFAKGECRRLSSPSPSKPRLSGPSVTQAGGEGRRSCWPQRKNAAAGLFRSAGCSTGPGCVGVVVRGCASGVVADVAESTP